VRKRLLSAAERQQLLFRRNPIRPSLVVSSYLHFSILFALTDL
jgi:hypothetical protein